MGAGKAMLDSVETYRSQARFGRSPRRTASQPNKNRDASSSAACRLAQGKRSVCRRKVAKLKDCEATKIVRASLTGGTYLRSPDKL